MADELTPSLENTPQVNQEFLSQSTDIGGVLNPTSYESTPFELPKIAPNAAVRIPNSYMQAPKISEPPQTQGESPLSMDNLVNLAKSAQDKYKYGKTWAYDADYTGVFYDRYANMGSLSKKLGFSPWRNNDEIYNSSSTWADNFKRSMRNSMSLANISFKGSLPWNAWDGEVSLEDAKNQERAFAEGQDSRGTIGASANNLFLNTGFTVGVLGELAVESAVIWGAGLLLAPVTGGGSLAGSGVAEGAEVVNATRKILTIPEMYAKLKNTATAIKDLAWARSFYGQVKSGAAFTKMGKAIVPNTVDYVLEMNKLSKAGTEMSNLAKVSKGVGSFYRDVQMVNGALSESKMEAGSVELELRNKITDQFYAENNRMPTAEEYGKIYGQARAGGEETFWMNLPAIYLSNKIVFDKAFSSLKPMRATREALAKGLRGWTLKEGEAGLFEPVKTGMRADIKSMFNKTTWKPQNLTKNLLGKMVTYGKANVTEGLQEQYQEGVSGAMKEYYQDTYFNPALIGQKASYLGKNMADQFTTAQGWETFASGFLTGGIIQGPQHLVFTKGSELVERITDKAGYDASRKAAENKAKEEANALNDLIKFSGETTKNADSNAGVQLRNAEYLRGATENQDKKGFMDIVGDSMSKHFYTLAKGGKLSIFRDSMKDLSSMSSQELVDAYGDPEGNLEKSADRHRKTLNGMLDMANEIEQEHKNVSEIYQNPFNPWRYKKDSMDFAKEAKAYAAFEDAKEFAVMSRFNYSDVNKRMESLYQRAASHKAFSKADAADFQMLYDMGENLDVHMRLLNSEIASMENLAGSDKKLLKEKKKKLAFLEELAETRDAFDESQTQDKEFHTRKEDEQDDVLTKLAVKAGSDVSVATKEGTKRFIVSKVRGNKVYDENGKGYSKQNLILNDTLRIGASVTYTDKDGKTTQFIIADAKKTVVYDSEGKSYPKKDVVLSDVKDRKQSLNAIMQANANKLFTAYSDYTRHLAQVKNDVLFDSDLDASFRDYLDFLRLRPEKYAMADAVNTLNNPEHLRELFNAALSARELMEEANVELLENALADYRKKYAKNQFLNKLLEEGMFLDENSLEILFSGKLPGVVLRHAVAPYAPVTTANDSEKYKKGMALLNQWLTANGFEVAKPEEQAPVTPTPAPEATTEPVKTEEPAVVNTPVSDIEAEKVKITEKEFKEVVRLAKFFLENPREPDTIGSMRSKYPELSKAVTDIEKRRQDALSDLGNSDNPFISRSVDNINDKHDEELEDLIPPATAVEAIERKRKKDKKFAKKFMLERTAPERIPLAYLKHLRHPSFSTVEMEIDKHYDAELAALEKKPSATVTTKTALDKKALSALGYGLEEIEAFDEDTIADILLNSTTKKQRDENLAKGKLTEKEKQAQKEKEELIAIKNAFLLEIGQATKYDDLTETVDAINDWIQENPESTEEEAKELYDAIDKKKIALNELTYESLNIGDFVWYENEVYTVFGKKKNKLDIRSIKGAPAKVATIAKNEVPTKLKKYFKPMDPKPPVSPEAQDAANKSVENNTEINKDEKIKIISEAQKTSFKEGLKDTKNKKGC